MFFFGKDNRRDINLIPEEQQQLKSRKNFLGLATFFVIVVFLLAALYGGLYLLQQAEKSRSQQIDSETEQKLLLWQKVATPAASLKNLRVELDSYKKFTASQNKFEEKLDLINAQLPSKVQFLNLSIDSVGKTLISAKAESTSVVDQLLRILRANTAFKDVTLNSLNKGATEEVNFNLSLVIK